LQYINTHPGAHLRQVKRDLGLSMGVTQYHLYALEKDQKIVARRNGLYKRFFPALTFGEHQQEILDILSQESERDLLMYMIQNPGTTQKELSQYSRLSPGTINWHMKRLTSIGLVSLKREGQYVRYSVSTDQEEILNLIRSYHPNTFQLWVDRFVNAIDAVTQLSGESVPEKAQEISQEDQEKRNTFDQSSSNQVESEGTIQDADNEDDHGRGEEDQS